jgi:hypothetical protein
MGICSALLYFWLCPPANGQVITSDPNLADEQVALWYSVAFDDAGQPGLQPHLKAGSDYRFPEQDIPLGVARAGHPVRTAAFGDEVWFFWAGLKPEARYRLRLTFLSDGPRTQQVVLDGRVVVEELRLPESRIVYCIVDLPFPQEDGKCELKIRNLEGPNALVSMVELYSNHVGLLPDPVFEANGDCRGGIRGFLFDRNRPARPYSGIEIRLVPSDPARTMSTQTDDGGHFGFKVPRAWAALETDSVRVTAALPGRLLALEMPMQGVFPPRLTPRPVHVRQLSGTEIGLSGTWRFHASPPEDFTSLDPSRTAAWASIQVPGEWAMQGFTVPPGTAAAYLREFDLPASWLKLRTILRCDAVYSDAVVYINGVRAGTHRGGFTAFELDVTGLVKPGRNVIALSVKNESLEDILASGSQYAAHPLGGITRKLSLWAVPPCFVSRLHTTTRFVTGTTDAMLDLQLEVFNATSRGIEDPVLHVSLRDRKGHSVPLQPGRIPLPALPALESKSGHIALTVPRPRKWDSGHPYLYTLTCTLEYGGRIQETLRRRIGFRQIEIKGDRVLVNGSPIKLRGVNRHEAHPLRGRSLTPGLWREDALKFRDANINYIRTSHYPPAEEFLQACDELGLFVECEAPLCWVQHGANTSWDQPGWDYRDRRFLLPLMLANLESVELNRDHPSILIWSLANESRWSPLFAEVLEMVKQADPSRPVSFHDQCWGTYNNAGSTGDIANFHYPGPDGPARASQVSRPLLFGEYCHLNAYNRHELVTDPGLRDAWGGPFQAMWEAIYADPGILGGALWSGIDDTFFLPSDGPAVGYGTWGPLDGWRREKPEYWHIKKTYSPIKLLTRQATAPQEGEALAIELENRHDFTDIAEMDIRWSLSDGRTGRATGAIPPRQRGVLHIPVTGKTCEGRILRLDFNSPLGFRVDAFEIPIGDQAAAMGVHGLEGTIHGPPELARDRDSITVTGGGLELVVDTRTGRLRSGRLHDRQILTGGPELMLLPLNGEGGTQMTPASQEFAPFTHTCTGWKAEAVEARPTDDGVSIRITGSYDQAAGEYTLNIRDSGAIEVHFRFTCREEIDPRQIGLVFSLPKEFETLTWKRRGLWSFYPEDHIGRLEGSASAFPGHPQSGPAGPRSSPSWPWSQDGSALGSGDFRSTKSHIEWAFLSDSGGHGFAALSGGGEKHVRCWVEGNTVRMLIAVYSNAGAERFYVRHARSGYRPLKPGSVVSGSLNLRFVENQIRR